MSATQVENHKEKGTVGKELALVKAKASTSTDDSERIVLLEMLPKKEWFIRTTFRGKVMWYVRLAITGLRPRIYGPFSTKRAGLLFLDGAIDKLADVWNEVNDVEKQYSCRGEFQHVSWGPIIEHPLAAPRETGALCAGSADVCRQGR